jgi:hypothetical protein
MAACISNWCCTSPDYAPGLGNGWSDNSAIVGYAYSLSEHLAKTQQAAALPRESLFYCWLTMEYYMSAVISNLKSSILNGMVEYIEDNDAPPYTQNDINDCEAIISNFIRELSQAPPNSNYALALDKVKDTVLKLNALNERCDYSIIEPDQREDLCELIVQVVKSAGYHVDADITAQWREW